MPRNFDKVARIAARQHGRATTAQMLEAGVREWQIRDWHADRLLHREHDGVYAVGHAAPSALGELMSAVLACGDEARVADLSAAFEYGCIVARPLRPQIVVPTLNGRSRPGIDIHRVAVLPVLDTTDHHGVPFVTVPRALLDMARRVPEQMLTRAGHQAWVLHRTGMREIEACLARNPHRPGRAKLRRALGADVTLSELEDGFLVLLDDCRILRCRTNVDVRGHKVDCHWPAYDLTVELHGYRFHASRQAFEADVTRRRRTRHTAFSWGDVFERRGATAGEVIELLRTCGWRRPG